MASGYVMGGAGNMRNVENYELQSSLQPPGPGSKADQKAKAGVAFSTNFADVGVRGAETRIFNSSMPAGIAMVDEERRLIDRVFSIVDKDRSNSIEIAELQDMFKIFHQESDFLSAALKRIMGNVENARASGEDIGESTGAPNSISPSEFYHILSRKFNPGDPKRDIENVFHKMDKNHDGRLDWQEIYELSQVLGENEKKEDIQDMVSLFSRSHQKALAAMAATREKKEDQKKPDPPGFLTLDDFFEVMQVSLVTTDGMLAGGYKIGERVWYTGPSDTTSTGTDKLMFSTQGIVRGPAEGSTTGCGVMVDFDRIRDPISCLVTYLSNQPPEADASAADVIANGSGEYKTNDTVGRQASRGR